MRRSPLKRKTPLRGQGATLSRTPKPKEPETFEARIARQAWHTVPWDAPCVSCGEPVHGAPPHHAVGKQILKGVARSRSIPAWVLLWSPAVRVIVCRSCHAAHENASPRLRRACLSTANLSFAADMDCEVYVGSRFYST